MRQESTQLVLLAPTAWPEHSAQAAAGRSGAEKTTAWQYEARTRCLVILYALRARPEPAPSMPLLAVLPVVSFFSVAGLGPSYTTPTLNRAI